MDEATSESARPSRGVAARVLRTVTAIAGYSAERILFAFHKNISIIARESDLFLGSALALGGVLSFQSGRFCDGNAADYLSCTRPATYYYYDSLTIALIVIGVFFILLWCFKSRRAP